MGYEDAPATKMLATSCAVCRRPLLDAASVDFGIGPDCRKRHGFNEQVDEASRRQANEIVHRLACRPSDRQEDIVDVLRLAALGFVQLSRVMLDRMTQIRIEEEHDDLLVTSPYSHNFLEHTRWLPGRRWLKDVKKTRFSSSARGALWSAIKACYPGAIGIGPKGPFTVPDAA